MTKTAALATADIMAALRTKYAGADEREWSGGFYLEECGINGNGQQSRCDALYAGFTSASGRLLIGHEVKVSRSDWLAELKKVGKADFWHDNCHQWYVVAHSGVLSEDELPEGWGLMFLQGSRLITKVKPATRQVTPSWDAVRSMLSRAETLRAESVRSAMETARQRVGDQTRELESRLHVAEQLAGGSSELQGSIRKIVAGVNEARRSSGYFPIDVDRVVGAVVDAAELEQANQALRRHIENSIQNLDRIAMNAKSMYAPLRKILEEMHA